MPPFGSDTFTPFYTLARNVVARPELYQRNLPCPAVNGYPLRRLPILGTITIHISYLDYHLRMPCAQDYIAGLAARYVLIFATGLMTSMDGSFLAR